MPGPTRFAYHHSHQVWIVFLGFTHLRRNTMANQQNRNNGASNRGFASMDPDRQREIASQGGKASHAKGTGHEFSSEEAREAGRKGGQSTRSGNTQTR